MHFLRIPTPQQIAQRQREEAEREHLAHEAAAEHHIALSRMYKERIARLSNVVPLQVGKPR